MVSIGKLNVIVFYRETHNALIQFINVAVSETIRKHYVLLSFDWIKINWNKWGLLSKIKDICALHGSQLYLCIKSFLLSSFVVDLYCDIISASLVSDIVLLHNYFLLILLNPNLISELRILARAPSINPLNIPLVVKYFIRIITNEVVPELWIHCAQHICTRPFVCDYLEIKDPFPVANHFQVIISLLLSSEESNWAH